MKRLALAAAALLLALPSLAGEFFEKNGVALRGYDPVAYFTEHRPVEGSAEFTAEYQGSTFRFANKANRDAFAAAPTQYAPQYGGYCAYGTALGQKVAVDPAAFSVVDGKLYLNYNRDIQKQWSGDIPGNITKADANWPVVRRLTKVVE